MYMCTGVYMGICMYNYIYLWWPEEGIGSLNLVMVSHLMYVLGTKILDPVQEWNMVLTVGPSL